MYNVTCKVSKRQKKNIANLPSPIADIRGGSGPERTVLPSKTRRQIAIDGGAIRNARRRIQNFFGVAPISTQKTGYPASRFCPRGTTKKQMRRERWTR